MTTTADLVKDTSTTVGAANIIVAGAPPVGFRAFPTLPGAAVGVKFGYKVANRAVPAEVEVGIGTIVALNPFEYSRAPAGGAALLVFSAGTKDVEHVVTAAEYNSFVSAGDVPFSESVPLSHGGNRYMPQTKVAGALNFTPAENPVKNSWTYLRLVMNGTNLPADTGFQNLPGHEGYTNTDNMLHMVQFFHDGYESYRSVNPLYIVASAATAVTLTGSTSGVVGAATTFTVGTNGTRSASVTVTPTPVTGVTYSPTSVTLPPGTGTATFTGTSATTGGKSVAVTNNGGLTNPAAITWTVAAAATAPGAPTIGAATSTGATSASVAGTAPGSDGGAAIDLYRATSSPGGIAATSATLPVPVPGLTTGQAYTFTLAAHNSVNWSTESAASNSVTPAAAAAFPRLIENAQTGGNVHYVETGTGPYFYSPTGVYLPTQQLENINQVRAIGALSTMKSRIDKFERYTFGVHASATPPAQDITASPSLIDFSVYTGSGNYIPYIGGAAQTPTNSVTMASTPADPLDGDQQMWEFTSTTTLAFKVSKNKGSTWTTVFTFTVSNILYHFLMGSSSPNSFALLGSTAVT